MYCILPLHYFGSIGYFRKLVKPNAVVELNEYYIKQTGRNRCYILSANGIIPLSVPVIKPNGSKTALIDIQISYLTDWQRIHWRAIESAYASAAFFDDYQSDIRHLIYSGTKTLHELNIKTIQLVDKWLDLKLNIEFTSVYLDGKINQDYRQIDRFETAIKPYFQLFDAEAVNSDYLSILDLIFAEGPLARKWLID